MEIQTGSETRSEVINLPSVFLTQAHTPAIHHVQINTRTQGYWWKNRKTVSPQLPLCCVRPELRFVLHFGFFFYHGLYFPLAGADCWEGTGEDEKDVGLLWMTAQDFVYRVSGGVTDGPPPPHSSVYDNIPGAPRRNKAELKHLPSSVCVCVCTCDTLRLTIHHVVLPHCLLFAHIGYLIDL